jgi:hypothetical protein
MNSACSAGPSLKPGAPEPAIVATVAGIASEDVEATELWTLLIATIAAKEQAISRPKRSS